MGGWVGWGGQTEPGATKSVLSLWPRIIASLPQEPGDVPWQILDAGLATAKEDPRKQILAEETKRLKCQKQHFLKKSRCASWVPC